MKKNQPIILNDGAMEECGCHKASFREESHWGQHSDCRECGENLVKQAEAWMQAEGGDDFLVGFFSNQPSHVENFTLRRNSADEARNLFDHYAFGKPLPSTESWAERFNVVAMPKSSLPGHLLPGDVVLSRSFGEGKVWEAMALTGEFFTKQQAVAKGYSFDSNKTGVYIEVATVRPVFRHHGEDFVKRVGDERGRLLADCMIVRAKQPDYFSSIAPEAIADEGSEFAEAAPQPTIAPDLAIAAFSATLKSKMYPILSPEKNKEAIAWNAKQHPGKSGVDPQTILDSLKKNYVDLASIEAEIKRHNAATPSSSIDLGIAVINGIFVESVHQFQQKCFTDKGQHDGKGGSKVLHSLGIIEPAGKNPLADVNPHTRPRIRDKGITGRIGNVVIDYTNWFDFIVNPSFFGWTTDIDPGVHYELAKRLRQAENWLLSLPIYQGISPAELGVILGIAEVHKGYRRTKSNDSQHNYGLGIDISYETNPFVRGKKIFEVIKDASLLLSGMPDAHYAGATYAQQYFFSLSKRFTTTEIHLILWKHHEDFIQYLRLKDDLTQIKILLGRPDAPAGMVKQGEALNAAAARWQRKIRDQFKAMGNDISFELNRGGFRDPLNGFISHDLSLVFALREQACLAWGAVDFGDGPGQTSGDIMHFDMRSIAPFSKIGDTAKHHPCNSGTSLPPNPASATKSFAGESAPQIGWPMPL
jgi:hypothetical protein